MFGTVFKVRPKPGKLDEIAKLMATESNQRGPVAGFHAGFRLHEANGDVWIMAIFENEELYRKNASDPEQDKWYRQFRELIESDPEWHDGAIMQDEFGRG